MLKVHFEAACSPSVSLALPPVGVHSTAEQLLHTTTLWEWLNTVVLHSTPVVVRTLPKGRSTPDSYEHEIIQANAGTQ